MRFLKILSFVSVLWVSTSFGMDLPPGGQEPKNYSFYFVMMSMGFYNEISDMLQQNQNIVIEEQNQTTGHQKRGSKNFEKIKGQQKNKKVLS